MSYDLNVHRQVECFGEDPERDISEAEWQNYVAKHEQLVFSTENPELAVLGDPSSCGPWLRWIGGLIDTQSPSDDFIEVVLDVAGDFKAWVHGDDGEQYVKTTFGYIAIEDTGDEADSLPRIVEYRRTLIDGEAEYVNENETLIG